MHLCLPEFEESFEARALAGDLIISTVEIIRLNLVDAAEFLLKNTFLIIFLHCLCQL